MYVLPNRDEVQADVKSEILHRGIFDASVYRTELSSVGTFDLTEMKFEGPASGKKENVRFDWKNAQVIVAIGDRRGIEEGLQCELGGQKIELKNCFDRYRSGQIRSIFHQSNEEVICRMVDLSAMVGKEVNFSLSAKLKGAGELNIAPIGQNTKIELRGNSADPSFIGMTLPSARQVSETGFEATWKINSLNRSDVDQTFFSTADAKSFQTVGAKLLVPGGQYTQTDRALKYAFLVILLSLMAVYVGEMSVRAEINFLNYLLIGAALVLFYLMLLSFGEWIGFSWSYGLSALLVLGMITLYLKAIVRKGQAALAVCLFMALIDVFVYVLLSLADMALLVGTLGLFVVLGAAMYFSLRMVSDRKTSASMEKKRN
jgi:inner membrane protein